MMIFPCLKGRRGGWPWKGYTSGHVDFQTGPTLSSRLFRLGQPTIAVCLRRTDGGAIGSGCENIPRRYSPYLASHVLCRARLADAIAGEFASSAHRNRNPGAFGGPPPE